MLRKEKTEILEAWEQTKKEISSKKPFLLKPLEDSELLFDSYNYYNRDNHADNFYEHDVYLFAKSNIKLINKNRGHIENVLETYLKEEYFSFEGIITDQHEKREWSEWFIDPSEEGTECEECGNMIKRCCINAMDVKFEICCDNSKIIYCSECGSYCRLCCAEYFVGYDPDDC